MASFFAREAYNTGSPQGKVVIYAPGGIEYRGKFFRGFLPVHRRKDLGIGMLYGYIKIGKDLYP
jgi:hypothetical protein